MVASEDKKANNSASATIVSPAKTMNREWRESASSVDRTNTQPDAKNRGKSVEFVLAVRALGNQTIGLCNGSRPGAVVAILIVQRVQRSQPFAESNLLANTVWAASWHRLVFMDQCSMIKSE
jgi:hypothetical protein